MRILSESWQNKLISNQAEFSWPLCHFCQTTRRKAANKWWKVDAPLLCMEKSGWIKAEAQGQRAHLVETEQSQRGKRETKVGTELGCRKCDFINVCQNKDRKMDGMFLAIKQKLDLVFTNWQLASEGFLLQHQSKTLFFSASVMHFDALLYFAVKQPCTNYDADLQNKVHLDFYS